MKILVYGFYGSHLNRGDELFKDAFKYLFPKLDFIFTDNINSKNIQNIDAVIFGGGSLLYGKINIDGAKTLQALMQKKIFYIGVGVESEINTDHIMFLKNAQLIATRSLDQVDRLKELNHNVMWIPDLVFSLYDLVKENVGNTKLNKSILINPNVYVLPKHSEPQWKYIIWNYFKSEFAQFLDYIIQEKYKIHFLPLCTNNREHDNWVAYELLSYMDKGNNNFIIQNVPYNFIDLINLYSKYETIISQRYHGMILAEIAKTSFIGICHHDKLENHKLVSNAGEFISFNKCSKRLLIDTLEKIQKEKYNSNINSYSTIFDVLKEKVNNLLK